MSPDLEASRPATPERLPHVVTFSCLYVDGEVAPHRPGLARASRWLPRLPPAPPHPRPRTSAAYGVLTHGNVRSRSASPAWSTEDVQRLLAALPALVADLRARPAILCRVDAVDLELARRGMPVRCP